MITERVLSAVLADDERLITTVLGLRLQQMGVTVRHAHDGHCALELIEDTHPDLVVLDVKMPGCDGLTVCETMASKSEFSDIPVVILTGRSDDRTLRRIKQMGATYICKSGDMWGELKGVVKQVIELSAPHYQLRKAGALPDEEGQR